MVRLLRILSIVMLVVYLTVGCCAPHAQMCDSHHACTAAHGGMLCERPCGDCGCDPPNQEHRKCQDRRYFVAKLRRGCDDFSPLPLPASFAVLTEARISLATIDGRPPLPASGRLLIPVRLHLANQVLLI